MEQVHSFLILIACMCLGNIIATGTNLRNPSIWMPALIAAFAIVISQFINLSQ